MSSSIRRFDSATRSRLTAIGLAGLLFVLTHAALEQASRISERHLDAFLWRKHDTLRLFGAHNYAGKGRGRIMIYGPSEAREALLPEEIRRHIAGLVPYQNSQSVGTLEDGLVILDYVERAYGSSAVPEALLLGITPRFVGNIKTEPSPLLNAIDRYSPHFSVDRGPSPALLVQRSFFESLRPRANLLSVQPDRYRRGVFAIVSRTATALVPSLAADRRTWGPISQAKYLDDRIATDAEIREWLDAKGNFWEKVFCWNPDENAEPVRRQLRQLTDYAARRGIQLYVVNLPELSQARERYNPNYYDAYMRIVREAFRDVPFLDLRTFLSDDDFYDSSHTKWRAGRKVSERVSQFVEQHRAGAANPGHAAQ